MFAFERKGEERCREVVGERRIAEAAVQARKRVPALEDRGARRPCARQRACHQHPANGSGIENRYEDIEKARVLADDDSARSMNFGEAAVVVRKASRRNTLLVLRRHDAGSDVGVDGVPPVVPDPERDADPQLVESVGHHRREERVKAHRRRQERG